MTDAEKLSYVRGYQSGRRNAAALARAIKNAEPKLTRIMVGGCTCGTKTPELKQHDPLCHFRLAGETLDLFKPVEKIGNTL